MQKQQRDEVFSSISAEETTIYRDLIREVRAQRKASSTGQFTARDVLGRAWTVFRRACKML